MTYHMLELQMIYALPDRKVIDARNKERKIQAESGDSLVVDPGPRA